jgi:hypothetical protein
MWRCPPESDATANAHTRNRAAPCPTPRPSAPHRYSRILPTKQILLFNKQTPPFHHFYALMIDHVINDAPAVFFINYNSALWRSG